MADGSLHSTLSGALTSQTMSMGDSSQHPQSSELMQQTGTAVPANPDMPVKRKPGRPKGSGKKQLENGGEPKIKRPVGRPRKDGLPAGSVGPKKPGRPKKREPGTFAAPQPGPVSAYGVICRRVIGTSSEADIVSQATPYGDATQWQASISAPPMGSLRPPPPPPNLAFPIDPNLDRENWTELARHRPDALLHALVTALSAPNPLSAAGITVEDAFKAHLSSLSPQMKDGNASNIPTLYSILKTFWLPTSPSYFALTASAGTSRVPSEHRFLYWDPQPLVFNGIACPACATPLINKGRIASGPIKVYDLGRPFFVIGCEYLCRSHVCLPPGSAGEGRKFASTDASILRSLPAKLKDEFPARLIMGSGNTPDLGPGPDVWNWRGMGVSGGLWDMVRYGVRSGLQKEIILGLIHSAVSGVPDEQYFQQAAAGPSTAQSMSAKKPEHNEAAHAHAGADEGDVMGEDGDEDEIEGELNKEVCALYRSVCLMMTYVTVPVPLPSSCTVQKSAEDEYNQGAWDPNGTGGGGEASGSGMQQEPAVAVAPPPPPPPAVVSHANHNPNHNDLNNVNVNAQQAIPPEYANPYPQQNVYMQHAYGYPPYGYYQQQPFPPQPAPPPAPGPQPVLKRTFALVESGVDGTPEPMHKRVRHCVKCGSNECKGKGGRAFCGNPCQDCGKLECKGRNSKRPDRTCADAWP